MVLSDCDIDANAERGLTAGYVKKRIPYISWIADDDVISRGMYINADMEYKAADSVIISAAMRGCFDAPGIWDTRRIWVTMIIAEAVVVATDRAMQEIITSAFSIWPGAWTWHTALEKYAIPVAEFWEPCHSQKPEDVHIGRHTNRSNIQDERNSHNFPVAVADNPTAPDLHQQSGTLMG
jgi:hypothetical protein